MHYKNKKPLLWVMFLCLAGPVAAENDLSLTRGPYLQLGTENSVVIKWRTNQGSNSRVDFGSAPNKLNRAVNYYATVTDHEVTLSGLKPHTTYYYQVGSTRTPLSGADSNHFFTTHPTQGSKGSVKLWVLGDPGYPNSSGGYTEQMYQGFLKANGGNHTDVWLMLGDNAYDSGTDKEYQTALFDIFTGTLPNSVLWSTRGNHETIASVYYDIYTHPQSGQAGGLPSGSEAYYSFDYANIHFICLDSQGTSRAVGGAMHKWVVADLADTTQDWIIAFWHHPPYSKGSHDSDTEGKLIDMRINFVTVLEDGGVDLTLTGHSHGYERSFLIDGHYGDSKTFSDAHKIDGGSGKNPNPYTKDQGAHNGSVYVIAGNASWAEGGTQYNHPAHYTAFGDIIGSMLIEVKGNTLNFQMINVKGGVLDSFTIVKNIDGAGETVIRDYTCGDNDSLDYALFVHCWDETPSINATCVCANLVEDNDDEINILDFYYFAELFLDAS